MTVWPMEPCKGNIIGTWGADHKEIRVSLRQREDAYRAW